MRSLFAILLLTNLYVTQLSAQALLQGKEVEFIGSNHFEEYDDGLITSKNMSAAICMKPDMCFAMSDETRFLQRFSLSNNELQVGGHLYLVPTATNKEEKDSDIEALASIGNTIIAVGSHSWARTKCKKRKRNQKIFIGEVESDNIGTRVPIKSTIVSLKKAFKKSPLLKLNFNKSLQKNGLNIEGATVFNDRVYFGFRAPTDLDSNNPVLILSVNFKNLLVEDFEDAILHALELSSNQGVGIRAMETVPDGIIILTGDSEVGPGENGCEVESSHRGNPYALHYWNPNDAKVISLGALKVPNPNWKAEGLLALPNAQNKPHTQSLIVFFDGAENGAPRKYLTKIP